MARGELTSIAARIKQTNTVLMSPWHQKIVVWLAKRFGSIDPLDVLDYGVESFTSRFWGFFFLLVGTVLQALGVFY